MLGRLRLIITYLIFVFLSKSPGKANEEIGYFWQVTDQHWDPTYTAQGALSCGDGVTEDLGSLGDYKCDAPWSLITESINAMKRIHPNPDFIIWTGDNTPHIWDDELLSLDVVQAIIGNLTQALFEAFPDTVVYPAIGNHDWSPKNQVPPYNHSFYGILADMWRVWLPQDSDNQQTFLTGGYFRAKAPNSDLQILVLNTNLYYDSNSLTEDDPDPAGQFQWMQSMLNLATSNQAKVILVAHVPPGMFEKHRSKHWFYPHFNRRFRDILQTYSTVIGSAHFSHHHTDSFRLIYNNDKAVASLLLAPAVTPWATTLAGVIGGAANNPAVRLVQYHRNTGTVLDVFQYYLNLTAANEAINQGLQPTWHLAYQGSKYFDQDAMDTSSLDKIASKMLQDQNYFHKYYKINGVLYDPDEGCTSECMFVHYCAITKVDYSDYQRCMEQMLSTASTWQISPVITLCVIISFLQNFVWLYNTE